MSMLLATTRGRFYFRSARIVIVTAINFLLLSTTDAIAQCPPPANDDAFMYINCGQNEYNPPGIDTVCFDIRYNVGGTGTQRITGFAVPLIITSSGGCLVSIDTTVTASFPSSSGVYGFGTKAIYLHNSGSNFFHIAYGAITFGSGVTGDNLFARICIVVDNSCVIEIDTLFVDSFAAYSMVQEDACEFRPDWGSPPGYFGGTSCEVVDCIPSVEIGTGYGSLPDNVSVDYKNHIDTYYNCSNYSLIDLSRLESNKNLPGHNHNGNMPPLSFILTSMSSTPQQIVDSDTNWNEPAHGSGVDAHVYTARTYDYLLQSLGWNSYDNLGGFMQSIVEFELPDSSTKNYSAYEESLDVVLVFPAAPDTFFGIEIERFSYASCPEMVAHEWAHGVTKYTSGLAGSREAGALAEGFSDMFGAAVAKAYGDTDWWLIGQNSYQAEDAAVRDMSNPFFSLPDPLPDTYEGQYWYGQDTCLTPNEQNDSCGVHTNMGVPIKMFYLLSNGGTHNGVTVAGIGIENAIKIMFRANQVYWADTVELFPAAVHSLKAAFDAAAVNLNSYVGWPSQTYKAWQAVNVLNCTILPGDVNASNTLNIADIIHLANHLFHKPGDWTPNPPCRGDTDGSTVAGLADVIWLVNYIFDKPRLSCVQGNPISCWLPIPTDVCCKLP